MESKSSKKAKQKHGASGFSYRRTIRINGKKIERTFSRRQDADQWYLERKREKELCESGMAPTQSDICLNDFAAQWMEKRKSNGKPFSSWSSDEQRLRLYVLPRFGDRTMSEISLKEWEDFFDDIVAEDEVSPATRNRTRSLATKLYNDAIRMALVANNPVRLIPKLKESMAAWDYFHSHEEVLTYLSEAQNECEGFKLFAYLALNTGARVGEILPLSLSDFNLPQRRMHISKILEEASGDICERTKGHCSRWLGMNEALHSLLLNHKRIKVNAKPQDLLIVDANGKRFSQAAIRRIHRRVCRRARLKQVRVHDLRHTYASHYIMNGGGLSELQMLLGHSTPQMTQKYAHLAPGFLESKAKVVCFSPLENNVVSIGKKVGVPGL